MNARYTAAVVGAAALACALAALRLAAQAATASSQPAPRALSASTSVPDPALQVIREIVDPSTGDRWLLVRDWSSPGGPGRLLLLAGAPRALAPSPAPAEKNLPASKDHEPAAHTSTAPAPIVQAPIAHAPIIHPNDPLVVEEDSPLVEARLAATALAPAAPGAWFAARLEIGGKIVRVRALAPGRAALTPEMGAQP
jgi:hypothetical protein